MNDQGSEEPSQAPLPMAPSDSDQLYLRMLEMALSQCTDGKLKLSLLLEYCNTGLSVLAEFRTGDPKDPRDAEIEDLRKTFEKLPKTPSLASRYEPDVDLRGMVYNISVKEMGVERSTFGTAQEDHSVDLITAIDLAYEGVCAPFINLKMRIRTLLKLYGIVTTLDMVGEMAQRLRDLASMPEEDRRRMLKDAARPALPPNP